MTDEILTDIPNADSPLVPEQEETEQPVASSPEVNETENEPSAQGEPAEVVQAAPDNTELDPTVPLHMQKRFQEVYGKAKEFDAFKQEASPKLARLDELEKKLTPAQDRVLPQSWIFRYGDTPDSRQAYELYLQEEEQRDSQRETVWLSKAEEKLTAESRAQAQAEQSIHDQVAEMKAEGQQFEENGLRKFLVQYAEGYGALPTIDNIPGGLVDMRRGLKLMRQMQPDTTTGKAEARQKVAEAAGADPKAEVTPSKTSNLGKSWWDN